MSIKKFLIMIISLFIFTPSIQANEKITVTFNKCIDGDTASFIYNNESITVRFLAIDTPETKHPTKGVEPYGKEASEYTCSKIKNADEIILEFDENSDKTDKYNRYLAWIWINDELLQKDLIKIGYAKVSYLYDNYTYTEDLKKIQEEAQINKLGLWSDEINETKNTEINIIEQSTPPITKDQIKITIIILMIIIILLLFDNKIRKKTYNQLKRNTKKEIIKQLKKIK